ncbi:murein hydrolase activator EnvC family protein [Brachybacterium sp. DNPG3]
MNRSASPSHPARSRASAAPSRSIPRLLALLLALLVGSGLLAPPGAGADGARWLWPVGPAHPVLQAFDAPEDPYGPGHRGIDIATSPGAEVRAVEGGVVRFSGEVAGRGVVSIMHADGLLSTYEPVDAEVVAGDRVAAGQRIGTIQEAGAHCGAAPCLHLGARRGEKAYIDPLPLLGARGPSILLRWEGA